MHKKIRLGMIGGGLGSMIGDIHRYAARLDNHYDLIAGVFSQDFKKTQQLGRELGLAGTRLYTNYKEFFEKETRLPENERIEVVAIVTPNDSHFAIAQAALAANLHIIIEKPLTCTLAEAQCLQRLLKQTDRLLCVTYPYSGYPMIKEARHLIRSGKLGKIRKVVVEFLQGWLATFQEGAGNKQASWRMDAAKGISGTIADIGTHAFHLAEYLSGLKAETLCADLTCNIANRTLEDDGTILLRYDNGATGIIIASQIALGEEVTINVKIYGEKGSLQWSHSNMNELIVHYLNQPTQIIKAGRNYHFLQPDTIANCRTPTGHSEGYLEAFANIYRNFAQGIKTNNIESFDFPTIDAGVRGLSFIETALASQRSNQKWLRLALQL